MSPNQATLLALLLAGHASADFLLQSDRMLAAKRRARGLLAHLLVVASCHALFLLPFLRPRTLAVLGALVLAHGAVDALKGVAGRRVDRPLGLLAADQAAHVATLAAAGWALAAGGGPAPLWPLDPAAMRTLFLVGAGAAAYAANWHGGAAVVGGVLARWDLESGQEGVPGTGRAIGILERMIVLTLVLLGEWGTLGLVLAAKSIARHDELRERRYAEYYLIGTLTSVLVAVVTGLLVRLAAGM